VPRQVEQEWCNDLLRLATDRSASPTPRCSGRCTDRDARPFLSSTTDGGHDPDCPVTVDPNLAILISEIALLYRRVGNVSKETRAVERLGTVRGAMEVRATIRAKNVESCASTAFAH
jgi:hypothetical protein